MMNIFQSVVLILRSFTLCRAYVYRDSLQRFLQASQQDESPVPTTDADALWRDDQWRNSTKGTIEWGGHLLGPPKKWDRSKLGKIKIRKEGQTVKKKVTTEKGWSVFSLQNLFPRKPDSDVSASSKVALNWSLRKNLVHNPLVPEFFSTIIMRPSIKMDSVSLR